MNRDAAKTFLSQYTPATAVQTVSQLRYHRSYHALLGLGRLSCDDDRSSSLLALSCAVYGWMPTILRAFEPERFNKNDPVSAIREIKTAAEAVTFLTAMEKRAPLNGSWIGTSKLMHMLNPGIFPIWDGRVAARFGPISDYSTNLKRTYISYLGFMHEEIPHRFDLIGATRDHINSTQGYQATDMRCLELLLFAYDPLDGSAEIAMVA